MMDKMKAMVKPDDCDPLKIRRLIALVSAVYALFVWPNLLIFYNLVFGMPESMAGELLLYIGTLSAGPVGAYLFAAHKKQAVNDALALTTTETEPEGEGQ